MASHPSGASLCESCSNLNLERIDFTTPPFEPEGRNGAQILVGTLEKLRLSKDYCKLCDLIWYVLGLNQGHGLDSCENSTSWSLGWEKCTEQWQTMEDELVDLYGSALWPELGEDGRGDYAIQLIDEADTQDFLRGRTPPQKVNVDMLLAWLKKCEEDHGPVCGNLDLTSTKDHPMIDGHFTIIDTHQMCLCDMPLGGQYIALSYVWGEDNVPVALKENVDAFKKKGGLNIELPSTISDAIHLTAALGFRYLWVDSLCITQNDNAMKENLISKMEKVYCDAAVTIVAASGNSAQAGLSGYRDEGRQLKSHTLAPDLKLGVLPFFDREIMDCDHARRAWTYQETCLSPRNLIFLNGFVYFACNTTLWAEHTKAEDTGVDLIEGANTLGKTVSEWPLRRYQQHVRSYSSRSLTHQSDGLNAFVGIANALPNSMENTTMIYGMPTCVFDWAVMWDGFEALSKRQGFPSWAWVGWKGEIRMPLDTFSMYDQQWLLKGTWIDWFRVDDKRQIVRLWDPARDNCRASRLLKQIRDEKADGVGAMLDQNIRERQRKDRIHDSFNYEDEEECSCPTYDWSLPSDIYGRTLHPSISEVLPPIQSIEQPVLRSSNIECNSLFFSTLLCEFQLRKSLHTSEVRTCHIIDLEGSKCGFVQWLSGEDSSKVTEDELYEILVLSVASYGVLSGSRRDLSSLDLPYRDGRVPSDEDDLPEDMDMVDFFNVMLVHPSDTTVNVELQGQDRTVRTFEKTGMGILHRDAVSRARRPSSWTSLFLT